MNKFWKIATPIIALGMVGCITITSAAFLSKREKVEAKAKASFKRTESLVESHTKDNPFKIWELVPETDMGEFAYMYDENELENWQLNLQTAGSKAARETYMNTTLKNKWYGLYNCSAGNEKYQAMRYEPYSEEFALGLGEDEADYKVLELAGSSLSPENADLPEGTPGYVMEEDPEGDYLPSSFYDPADKGSDGKYQGEFRQIVDYYVASNNYDQYYGVAFKKASIEGGELKEVDGQLMANGQTLYEAKTSHLISDEETYKALKEKSENTYIYRLDYESVYGGYEYVGTITEVPYDTMENDKYFYYTVVFSHVDTNKVKLSSGTNYYVANEDSLRFLVDVVDGKKVGRGEYGGVGANYTDQLNGKEGYFNCTYTECYQYVGKGNGTYHLKKTADGSLKLRVIPGKIYYKGGYFNNHILEKEVFGAEDKMGFDTNVVTPSYMKENYSDLSNVDLLYISSKSLIKEKVTGQKGAGFTKENDISWEAACRILMLAKEAGVRLPVIVDESIISGVDIKQLGNDSYTNLQRLVGLLSSEEIFTKNAEDKDVISIVEGTKVSDIPWNTLKLHSSSDFGFVNNNVYAYPFNDDSDSKNKSKTPYIYKSFTTGSIATGTTTSSFVSAATEKQFKEIADYINAENLSREMENNGLPDGSKLEYFELKITKATVIEYIINFASREERVWNSVFRVLEIEPGRTENKQPTLDAGIIKEQVLKANGIKVDSVEVTCITSSEFVGKIEDLSKYDMLYFGNDTSYFNTENNKTVYNDSSMDGLIYSNIGDIVVTYDDSYSGITEGFTGLLDSDYYTTGEKNGQLKNYKDEVKNGHIKAKRSENDYTISDHTFRTSGNDITTEKMKDVIDYVNAGYPVLVHKDFYKTENGKKKDVNDFYVDNCSKMYDLFKKIKDKDNVITYADGQADTAMLVKYLNLGKPVLTMSEHTYAKGMVDSKNENKFWDVKDNKLELGFKINNQGAANAKAKFTFSLYVDVNADGKFSETQEAVPALNMIVKKNGTKLQPVSIIDSSNSQLFSYELEPSASNEYTISYDLGDETIGLIPYKLEVKQCDNLLRTVSKQGYFYNKNTGAIPEIRVLQINTIKDQSMSWSTAKDKKEENNFNMEKELNSNSKFATYVKKLEAEGMYKLIIKTINSDEYASQYNDKKDSFFDGCVDGKPADMLVVGFGDMYSIGNYGNCTYGIVNFINTGKPVLFAHDTTSFYNNKNAHYAYDGEPSSWSKGPSAWGYDFNKIVRNVVGMDRYGVMVSEEIQKGKQLEENSTTTGTAFTAAKNYAGSNRLDLAYVPRSNQTKLAKQCEGFTYGSLMYYVKGKNLSEDYMKYWTYQKDKMSCSDMQWVDGGYVKQVNEGQITQYPYAIPQEFSPKKTHYQYYQLDMNQDDDNDGKSDIVVWYTLDNNSTSPYGASPGDVRNNYYIYTKGNVTYSGVGHSPVGDNENEVKLYINTIIAAYNAGVKVPSVSLKTNPDEEGDNVQMMYATFDQKIVDQVDGSVSVENSNTDAIESQIDPNSSNKDSLYYTVKDNNLVKNQVSEKSYAIAIFGVEIDEADYNKMSALEKAGCYLHKENKKTIYLKMFTPDMKGIDAAHSDVISKNVDGSVHFRAGITYKFDIDPQLIGDKSYVNIYVISRMQYVQKIKTYEPDGNGGVKVVEKVIKPEPSNPTVVSFRLQRLGLMDLD